MSAAAAPLGLAPTEAGLVRRVIARAIDDAIVVAFAIAFYRAVGTVVELNTGGEIQQLPGWADSGASTAAVLTLLALGLFVAGTFAFYLFVSVSRGRSPGRAVAGIVVVRADGAPASQRVLLGRELLRVALIAAALAIVWPLGEVVSATVQRFSPDAGVSDLVVWIGYPVVAAIWIGATLVDPLGRAPHDHIAGTRVVGRVSGAGDEDQEPLDR